jgi:hypothetical protein
MPKQSSPSRLSTPRGLSASGCAALVVLFAADAAGEVTEGFCRAPASSDPTFVMDEGVDDVESRTTVLLFPATLAAATVLGLSDSLSSLAKKDDAARRDESLVILKKNPDNLRECTRRFG